MIKRGFTLIEVLIAMIIISIGLAASYRAAYMASTTINQAFNRQLALWIAQNKASEVSKGMYYSPENSSNSCYMAGVKFICKISRRYEYQIESIITKIRVFSKDKKFLLELDVFDSY